MLERLGNDGDGMAAFELGRLLKCGLGDIRPRPHAALDWLQHALVCGVHAAAPLIVTVAIELGRGDLAYLAAAVECAVASEGAPQRRRVQRHVRARKTSFDVAMRDWAPQAKEKQKTQVSILGKAAQKKNGRSP